MNLCPTCSTADTIEKTPLPSRKVRGVEVAMIKQVAAIFKSYCTEGCHAIQESGSEELHVRQETSISEALGEVNKEREESSEA